MTQITELFAWVVDDPTGMHGIPATRPVPVKDTAGRETLTAMPMVTSKRHVAEKMRPSAMMVAKMIGLPVQLRHFTVMTVIDEVKP